MRYPSLIKARRVPQRWEQDRLDLGAAQNRVKHRFRHEAERYVEMYAGHWAHAEPHPRDAEAPVPLSRCGSVGAQIDVVQRERTRNPFEVLIAGDEREAT